MFFHELKYILALQEKRNFFCFYELLVVLPSPSTFFDSRNIHRVYPKVLLLSLGIFSRERLSHHLFKLITIIFVIIDGKLFNFLNNELLLFFNDVTDLWIVYGWMHKALHHRSSFIILDISFPSFRRHSAFFTKALFSEVAQCKVVGIGHQVLHFSSLHLL